MMTTDDPVLDALARANPHPEESIPETAGDPEARALLERIVATADPGRRSDPGHRSDPERHSNSNPARRADPAGRSAPARRVGRALAPVMSVAVALAVVALVLHDVSSPRRAVTSNGAAAGQITLRLRPAAPETRVSAAAVAHEIAALRARVRSAGGSGVRFIRVRRDELIVRSAGVHDWRRLERLLTAQPQIALTDWEANVIAPDGRTAASGLRSGSPAARTLSQGRPPALPGSSAAGAEPLYDAVRLASRQPTRGESAAQTRPEPESFAFAPVGAPSCPRSAVPCWAAGPAATPTAARRRAQREGVARPIVLTVPEGTLVAQATEAGAATGADYGAPDARFFVLRDDAALTTADFSGALAFNGHRQPTVESRFTAAGAEAFDALTATIAHRGASLAHPGERNDQHFAIIDDGRLLVVSAVDYRVFPDGLIGRSNSFEIAGGLTRTSAERIAAQLRLKPLPLATEIVQRPAG